MSRAYFVYLMTFAVLIAGMALIMTAGEAVRAPDDIAGEWVMEWDNAPPPESGGPILRIAQSGRFFVVTFGEAPPLSLTLQDGWSGKSKGRRLDMTLARPDWKLHLSGDIPGKQRWQVPELKLELVGPTRHVGIARRVYPETADAEAGEAAAPIEASERTSTPDVQRSTSTAEPVQAAAETSDAR